MLYGSGTWQVKDESKSRLERTDAKTFRWMCKVRLDDRISAEELKTRLILKGKSE